MRWLQCQIRSLPHRQLRNFAASCTRRVIRSLPHRQLRNLRPKAKRRTYCSLPHRQLRKSGVIGE
ncbi:hypothetical protein BZG18_15420 [Salinivibrio kushneri]|nr:hypothetical protein BZG18_15420 [Salinivibrio kushneri]